MLGCGYLPIWIEELSFKTRYRELWDTLIFSFVFIFRWLMWLLTSLRKSSPIGRLSTSATTISTSSSLKRPSPESLKRTPLGLSPQRKELAWGPRPSQGRTADCRTSGREGLLSPPATASPTYRKESPSSRAKWEGVLIGRVQCFGSLFEIIANFLLLASFHTVWNLKCCK